MYLVTYNWHSTTRIFGDGAQHQNTIFDKALFCSHNSFSLSRAFFRNSFISCIVIHNVQIQLCHSFCLGCCLRRLCPFGQHGLGCQGTRFRHVFLCPQRRRGLRFGDLLGRWIPSFQGFGTYHVQDAFRYVGSSFPCLLVGPCCLHQWLCRPSTGTRCLWERILGKMVLCPWILRRTSCLGNPRCRLDPTQERNVSDWIPSISSSVLVVVPLERCPVDWQKKAYYFFETTATYIRSQ